MLPREKRQAPLQWKVGSGKCRGEMACRQRLEPLPLIDFLSAQCEQASTSEQPVPRQQEIALLQLHSHMLMFVFAKPFEDAHVYLGI